MTARSEKPDDDTRGTTKSFKENCQMTNGNTEPARTARSLLVEWANGQDHWVRALAADIIESCKPLSDARAGSFYDFLLREKQLTDGAAEEVPPLVASTAADGEQESFFLVGINDAKNINALAPGQTIDFNERLTILFGENGAGKTGYVRILKRIASVRTAQPILPNVFDAAANAAPSATIAFRLNGRHDHVDWRDETGLHPFTMLDIFDSHCTTLHVDQDLTYVYTPRDLSLFRHVHDGLEGVRQLLAAEIQRRRAAGNPFLPKFARDTVVYPFIDSLGSATDLQALALLAAVSTEEEEGVQGLREKVEALRSSAVDAQLQLLSQERSLLSRSLSYLKPFVAFEDAHYRQELESLANANLALDASTQKLMAGRSIPGVLTVSWKAFISSSEHYIAEHFDSAFPQPADACPLCLRTLNGESEEVLRSYREFANGELRVVVEQAASRLQKLSAAVLGAEDARLPDDLVQKLEQANLSQEKTDFFNAVLPLIDALKPCKEAISKNAPTDLTSHRDQLTKLVVQAESLTAANESLATQLGQQSKERQAAHAAESRKLRDLEARLTLKALLPQITAYVEAAKWCTRAETFSARFRGMLKSLTDTAKVASEDLLNQDFERLFRGECNELKAPPVQLDFPGKRGEPARRKSLTAEHKLSDILSEGEQKVIALADFIAEASLKSRPVPIVFDDPVNSLDYKRLRYVAGRIAQMTRTRQVIVFTHNIWFACELLSHFEKDRTGCNYYDVSEGGTLRGYITRGSNPRTDSVNSIKGRINELLQDAGRLSGETRSALVERAYDLIRSLCEVIVETELLQAVTRRYQPNVMMTALPKIRGDRLEAATAVLLPIFEKACRHMAGHSQPLETLNVRPTLEECSNDLKAVLDARAAYIAS